MQQANLAQQQHDNDQKIANQQRLQDQASALDQQRQATLVKYQDDMRELLLNKGLLTSKPNDEIRVIARTETLSAMRQLDAKRNVFLTEFLQDAHLIGIDPNSKAPNIVSFLNADLRNIDLSSADLTGAILTDVHGLTQQELDQVNFCKGATLPSGLTCHHNQ